MSTASYFLRTIRSCHTGTNNLVAAIEGINEATIVVMENIQLREKLRELGQSAVDPLVKKDSFIHKTSNFVKNEETVHSKTAYSLNHEERLQLSQVYTALAHIEPKYISMVMAGHIESARSPIYRQVLEYLEKNGNKDLGYYKNLYWRSLRSTTQKSSYNKKGTSVLDQDEVREKKIRKSKVEAKIVKVDKVSQPDLSEKVSRSRGKKKKRT